MTRFFSLNLFQNSPMLCSPPSTQDISAFHQVSFPNTQNLCPMSTHPIHKSNPFSIPNPDIPISTTSRNPLPPPHLSCHTRQPKRSTPHSPTPSSSSAPQISISSSPPYKRTFVSQSSIPNSPPETLEDIQNFLKMTQGNIRSLIHPPIPLFLLLLHLKYLQIFIVLLPKLPPPPLPPTLSQHAPPSLPLENT